MPTATSPVATVFGCSTALGNIANIVDGDEATFWAPYADTFDSYNTPPIADSGVPIAGYPRPALQFDFGDRVRIPWFRPIIEPGKKALSEAWLLCSDLPASSVNDTVQAGDIYAGYFTVAQMNSGAALSTFATTKDIRGRYWRFVWMITPPATA